MTSNGEGPSTGLSVQQLSRRLHDQCLERPVDTIFSQADLLNLNVIPQNDLQTLLNCTNTLIAEGTFKLLDRARFKLVPLEQSRILASLSQDEALIYNNIEAAGREGIWTKIIKMRTNLHQSVVTRGIKSLESRGLIKSIKNVRFPARILYMLSSLTPSEDVTGGPWFTDGELDTGFVDELCDLIEKLVRERSFYQPIAERKSRPGSSSAASGRNTLPYPPGYTGYPSLHEITALVSKSKITDVPLAEEHVRQLCDILYYDRRLDRVLDGSAYKAIRRADDVQGTGAGTATGLAEVPCGRCPVFNLCGDGGPVSASSCEYLQDWLDS
ncbi:MAG: hypothetical protein M1825_002979 [Sarcosagium campestre]|nr:MAG: hypothetical protein M1825_002979 [Sarcosagium campestre]